MPRISQAIRRREESPRSPGEIELKLNHKSQSRHFRINHVPVDSILYWPRGQYEVLKETDPKTGQLTTLIVLRPDSF